MENMKEQHSFNPQIMDQESNEEIDQGQISQQIEQQQNENEKMKIELNEGDLCLDKNQKDILIGQKRKYTKRMQNIKIGEGDTNSVSNNGKDKNMGRWTKEEKQKFIDAIRWYGKDWKKVEQSIKTRSGAQIRSHAQKFFQNKFKSEGIDIDTYIQQLQQNHNDNKDLESSNHDNDYDNQNSSKNINDQNIFCPQSLNSNQLQHSFKNIPQQIKFVSVVNIDAPKEKQQLNLKSQQLKAFQKINRNQDFESINNTLKKNYEKLKQQSGNLFQPQVLKLSSSTPSEISSYMQQNFINKFAQQTNKMNIKDKNIYKIDGPLNILNMNEKNQQKFLSSLKIQKNQSNQHDQFNLLGNQQIQNIFGQISGHDANQKIPKLSPSKINSPIQNLQKMNTAKWNDGLQFQDEQAKFDINFQNSQIKMHKNQKNSPPLINSKIKINDDCDSPIKITICDDTSLEVFNLDLNQLNLDFRELWDLQINQKICKSSESQIYSDNPSLMVQQQILDLNQMKSQKQILQIPKILKKLQIEIENFNPKGISNQNYQQDLKISSIKICWHMNKNELFVYDFIEKALEDQKYQQISILNILEKNKASQRARIRNIQTKQMVKDIQIQNGTFLILQGGNIKKMSYEVPKVTARISDQIGRRISLILFYQKIEAQKFYDLPPKNILNLPSKNQKSFTKYSAISLKERDYSLPNQQKTGKTPYFGGNIFGKSNIMNKFLKNFEKQNKIPPLLHQADNLSDSQLQQNVDIQEVNKIQPSLFNLHSQDGNFNLSKQMRERANSGLTIQQTNSLKKNNFNQVINKPVFNIQNSQKKDVEFYNIMQELINKKKNQNDLNQKQNEISTFFNQNNIRKEQPNAEKTSTDNQSAHDQFMENKSQQESINSFLIKKNLQNNQNFLSKFLANHQENNVLKNLRNNQNIQKVNVAQQEAQNWQNFLIIFQTVQSPSNFNVIVNKSNNNDISELLNLIQPLIQQKKISANNLSIQNVLQNNKQIIEIINQGTLQQNNNSNLQNQTNKTEDKKNPFSFINAFRKSNQRESRTADGSSSPVIDNMKSNIQTLNKNIGNQFQIQNGNLQNDLNLDVKNQLIQNSNQLNQQMMAIPLQKSSNADKNIMNVFNNENASSNRRISEISKQSALSKVQSTNTPPLNWNMGIQNFKHPVKQRYQKISGESEIVDKLKNFGESPIIGSNVPQNEKTQQKNINENGYFDNKQISGEDISCVQSKQSQIDSFIGLMRQQNQQILESIILKNQDTSNFMNQIDDDQNNQADADQNLRIKQQENTIPKENEIDFNEYCTSLKSVQNNLNLQNLDQNYKNLQDQLSSSSIKTGLEPKIQSQKQKFLNIINKHYENIKDKVDEKTLEILDEHKSNLVDDLLKQDLQQSQIQILNFEQVKKSQFKNIKQQDLNDITVNVQQYEVNKILNQSNAKKIDQLIVKKQYLFYNFLRQLCNILNEQENSDSLTKQNADSNENKKQDFNELIKNYSVFLSDIQNQFLNLYVQEIKEIQILKEQQKILLSNYQQCQINDKFQQKISSKNFINRSLIKEMIDILNFQILTNMNIKLLKQQNEINKNSNNYLKEIIPFDIQKFTKLIPYQYAQQLQKNYLDSQEEQSENIKLNDQNKILQEQLNPESFLIDQTPVFIKGKINKNINNNIVDTQSISNDFSNKRQKLENFEQSIDNYNYDYEQKPQVMLSLNKRTQKQRDKQMLPLKSIQQSQEENFNQSVQVDEDMQIEKNSQNASQNFLPNFQQQINFNQQNQSSALE